MSTLKQSFGINLKLLRKARNITQEKLSELIDIHPRQMSKIETGEHFPSAKTLEKICCVLNIQPFELFDFKINLNTELTGTDNFQVFSAVKSKNTDKEYQENVTLLLKKFKKIAHDEAKINLVKLVFESFDDYSALEQLELIIKGMKLVHKNNK